MPPAWYDCITNIIKYNTESIDASIPASPVVRYRFSYVNCSTLFILRKNAGNTGRRNKGTPRPLATCRWPLWNRNASVTLRFEPLKWKRWVTFAWLAGFGLHLCGAPLIQYFVVYKCSFSQLYPIGAIESGWGLSCACWVHACRYPAKKQIHPKMVNPWELTHEKSKNAFF